MSSTSPPAFFQAAMRPCILQILRATGYYGSRNMIVDTLTDLSIRYLYLLSQKTALHALDNGHEFNPDIVDVRLALQDVGALMPEKSLIEEILDGEDDTRGVEKFMGWFEGRQFTQIMALPLFDGETEAPDYLTALKTKHSKTGEDTKYVGTVLGRGIDHGEIIAEGADGLTSIEAWEETIRGPQNRRDFIEVFDKEDSRPPSSGLSSLGDADADMDMGA